MSFRFDIRELQGILSNPNIQALLNLENQGASNTFISNISNSTGYELAGIMDESVAEGLSSLAAILQPFSAEDGEINFDAVNAALFATVENDPVYISTSSNYTTTGNEDVVIATAAITVTLNDSPDDGETVTVKRATTAGYVTVDGNGNTIDGDTDFIMVNNYDSYTFIYIEDAGEWLIT